MKAFLSSTFKDLEPYRAAVIARLRRLDGVDLRCMEDFGARASSPKEFCLQEARECDLFIGVIGHLYGFVPDGDKASITEQEYQAAERAGKEMLVFVAPDDFPVRTRLLRNDSDPDRQEAFRDLVLRQNAVDLDWSAPATLAAGIVQAVHNWRLERAGFVAGSALAQSFTKRPKTSEIKIFLSYAHEDEELMHAVRRQLVPFKRQGLISNWYDRNISAGVDWEGQIDAHLQTADIILLFISAYFFDSDYAHDVEMKEALRLHATGQARVIPIILRHCRWQKAIGHLQVLPKNGRPITSWEDQDEVCLAVAEAIMQVATEFQPGE